MVNVRPMSHAYSYIEKTPLFPIDSRIQIVKGVSFIIKDMGVIFKSTCTLCRASAHFTFNITLSMYYIVIAKTNGGASSNNNFKVCLVKFL